MSDARDVEIFEERKFRIHELEKGANRLETRAHELIIEAEALRKLAVKLTAINHEAKFEVAQ